MGWDAVNHLPKCTFDVWDVYVMVSTHILSLPVHINAQHIQHHPSAKPYWTKAFPLYDDIEELTRNTRATGKKTFRGGGSSEGMQITGSTGTSQASHSVIDPTLSMIDPSLLPDLPPISSDDETDTLVLLSLIYFCLFTDYFSHSLAPPSRHSPSTRSLRRVPLPPHTPAPTPLCPQKTGNKGPQLMQTTALSNRTCLTMT
jgi:hypothetical protein